MGVGREFARGHTLQNPPSWDALINAIISVCDKYELPEHYFGPAPGKRYLSGPVRARTSLALLAGLNGAALANTLAGASLACSATLCGLFVLYSRRMSLSPYRDFPFGRFDYVRRALLSRRKHFPVLIFNIFHGDGEPVKESSPYWN